MDPRERGCGWLMADARRARGIPRKPLARVAVAAPILCCTLALTLGSAATANPDHLHPARVSRPPAPAPATSGPSSAAAGPACCDAAPAPTSGPTTRHQRAAGKHGDGTGTNTSSAASPSAAPGSAGTPVTRAGATARERRERRRAGRGGTSETPTPTPAGATGGGSAGASSQQAGEAATPSSSRRRPRIRHDKPREPKHPLTTPQPAPTPPATAAAPQPSAVVSALVSQSAAAAAPAAVAAAPPSAKVQTSSAAPARHAATRRRHAGRARRAAPAAAGAHAPVLTGVLPAAAAHRSVATRKPLAPAAAKHAHAAESPLVKTVTRIINVVPPVVRALLAALVALALALALVSRVSAIRARRLLRQRSELLEDVGLLQAALLPPLPERLGPVATSAAYRPASGPGAGGDFYDVFALGDGRLAVIVGDVSGHGRQALPHTTLVRFTLRAYLEAGMSPRIALQSAAPALERQLGESFATVVLATYNPRERVLVYAAAGHPPPLLLGSDVVHPITVCSAPPLGVGAPTGTRQTTVSIPGAATACFYTDGVIEARVAGELFGVQRLEAVLATLDGHVDAPVLLEHVAAATDRHPDDMAACVLRVEGSSAAPAVRVEELELDARAASGDRAERFLLAAGMHPADTEATLSAVRSALGVHRRVVLELHLGDGEPAVRLIPHNVTSLQSPPLLQAATARGGF
jgi:serine phosphatase RsbU (regulator of sigma subunit)